MYDLLIERIQDFILKVNEILSHSNMEVEFDPDPDDLEDLRIMAESGNWDNTIMLSSFLNTPAVLEDIFMPNNSLALRGSDLENNKTVEDVMITLSLNLFDNTEYVFNGYLNKNPKIVSSGWES